MAARSGRGPPRPALARPEGRSDSPGRHPRSPRGRQVAADQDLGDSFAPRPMTLLQQMKRELLSEVRKDPSEDLGESFAVPPPLPPAGPPSSAAGAAAPAPAPAAAAAGAQARPAPPTTPPAPPQQPPGGASHFDCSALSPAGAPERRLVVRLREYAGVFGADFVCNVVTEVARGSAAERGGVYAGQRILRIGQKDTPTLETVVDALGAHAEDAEVSIAVLDPPPPARGSVASSTKTGGRDADPVPPFWASGAAVGAHEARGDTVFYRVDVQPAAGGPPWSVWRRYNMFVALRDRLGTLPVGAHFPTKHTAGIGGLRKAMTPEQVGERRQGLERWLGNVLPRVSADRKAAELLTQFFDPEAASPNPSAKNRLKGFVLRRQGKLFSGKGDKPQDGGAGEGDASVLSLGRSTRMDSDSTASKSESQLR
eukprot:TRINITY_DN69925_c0_g1_i1.p1 TRINITY_DN69925_c0_g1~~TRINITY_DN69925_c0_g1_i1.p1  ORF type:complete len:456 (+),score=122.46 TRINITY_DN69925_c0_g1_i1:91-1368(+)